MRSLLLSYLLCAAGFFTPFAGFHRFYLGKPISGTFYLITWGFFGIGTFFDMIRMPFLVDEVNMRELFSQRIYQQFVSSRQKLTSPERAILKCASNNGGIVTVQMVSMSSDLPLKVASQELNRLYREGYCQKDVDEDGVEIYQFIGLKAKGPLI